MAITANVDLGNGVSATSAYLIVPNAYVKKFDDVRKTFNEVAKKNNISNYDSSLVNKIINNSGSVIKKLKKHFQTKKLNIKILKCL